MFKIKNSNLSTRHYTTIYGFKKKKKCIHTFTVYISNQPAFFSDLYVSITNIIQI